MRAGFPRLKLPEEEDLRVTKFSLRRHRPQHQRAPAHVATPRELGRVKQPRAEDRKQGVGVFSCSDTPEKDDIKRALGSKLESLALSGAVKRGSAESTATAANSARSVVPIKVSGVTRPRLGVMILAPSEGAVKWRAYASLPRKEAESVGLFLRKLVHRALLRRFIRAPAQQFCAVAKAPPRNVVVAHLNDERRLERLPCRVLPRAPTTRPTRRFAGKTRRRDEVFELLRQRRSVGRCDAGREPDVVEQALRVV